MPLRTPLAIVLAWTLACAPALAGEEAQRVPVRQLWVIDGDTLDVLVPAKDRIRLEGIDAPEVHREHCPAEKARGLAAKAIQTMHSAGL